MGTRAQLQEKLVASMFSNRYESRAEHVGHQGLHGFDLNLGSRTAGPCIAANSTLVSLEN